MKTAALTTFLLLGATACSSDEPAAPPACDTPVTAASVTMGDFFYEPTCLQASNGDTVEVVNDGDAPHTFTVEGTDLGSNLEPHDTGELTFEGLTTGRVYEVTCIYHSNMTAALKAV
jgi:plastocyanin